MKAGKVVLDICPVGASKRNSEGSFVTLSDGRILFAYTKFLRGGGDASPAVIAARYSRDGGLTWSARDRVLVGNEGRQNVMSASLLRLHDGRIAMFYVVKNGFHDCRPRVRFSQDECRSWSRPAEVIAAPGYFVVNNDRVVQLSGGRLIVPAAFHRHKTEDTVSWQSFDHRGIAMYFLSDDAGASWREAKTWWALPAVSGSGLQEPGVIELADGRLMSWCRTDLGCQYALYSCDAGETWSLPCSTRFQSPCSPLSMKRIPSTGHLLAVWNDHSGRFGLPAERQTRYVRNPLVTAVSSDECNTWRCFKPVEIDPQGRFCYIAVHFHGQHVLLAYNAGGANSPYGGWGTLRIRRLKVDWLYE